MRTTDAEATAREWTRTVVVTRLARDANRLVGELERAAGHAAGWLDDPRSAEPVLAGTRARVLGALAAAGAVAVDREG